MKELDQQSVRTIIFDHLEPFAKKRGVDIDRNQVTNDWHLLERGLVTSVQALELMFQLEESLELEIDYLGRDPGHYLTLGGLIEIILEAAEEEEED